MNTYTTIFGFYALSNTPIWLDYEEKNVADKAPVENISIKNLKIILIIQKYLNQPQNKL